MLSKDKLCSYNETGKNFCFQQFYRCLTCYPQDDPSNLNKGICESCKNICHKGHHIVNLGMCYAFCDCGFGECPIKCKCMNNSKKTIKGNPWQKSKIKMSPFLPHTTSKNIKKEKKLKMSPFLPNKNDEKNSEENEIKTNDEIEPEIENKTEKTSVIELFKFEENESIPEKRFFIEEKTNEIEQENEIKIEEIKNNDEIKPEKENKTEDLPVIESDKNEEIKNNDEIEPEKENKTEDLPVIESNKNDEIKNNDEIETEESHLDESIEIEEIKQENKTEVLTLIESNKNEIKPIEVRPKEIPKNEQSLFLRSVKSPIKKPKVKTPPKPRIFHLYV